MSSLTKEKSKSIQRLLLKPNLTFISDNVKDFKCTICKGILINPRQTICGCNFCERCINGYKDGGGKCCPGNTEECMLNNLSSVFPDYRSSREISQLVVKCDSSSCNYRCELVNMETHMQNCPHRNIKNLGRDFNDYGNKDLVEIINSLKNEVKEIREKNELELSQLKEVIEKNKVEIKELKNQSLIKDQIIKTISIEIDRIKKDQDKLEENAEILKVNLENEINEINVKGKVKNLRIESMHEEIKSIKSEGDITLRTENSLTKYSEINNISQRCEELNVKVKSLQTYLDARDKTFVWHIGTFNKLNNSLSSEYFFGRTFLYKMGLQMWIKESEINIFLLIYSSEVDGRLRWPFEASVTVRIVNKFNQNKNISVAERCVISQPLKNQYQCSKEFLFSKEGLLKIGIMSDFIDCIVECLVDF